jgi:hypothetical protein
MCRPSFFTSMRMLVIVENISTPWIKMGRSWWQKIARLQRLLPSSMIFLVHIRRVLMALTFITWIFPAFTSHCCVKGSLGGNFGRLSGRYHRTKPQADMVFVPNSYRRLGLSFGWTSWRCSMPSSTRTYATCTMPTEPF